MYHNNSLFKTSASLNDNLQNFPVIFFFELGALILVAIISEKNP